MHRLITFPISHYSERARWALEYCGVPFKEERHLQFFQIPHVRRAGGKRTVPVLVMDSGESLTDSRDIVRFASEQAPADRKLLPTDPQALELVESWDSRLADRYGKKVRNLAYWWFLPEMSLLMKYNNVGAPWHERTLLYLGKPVIRQVISKAFNLSEDNALRARDAIMETFDDVARLLEDGRPFIGGEAFTTADLTFAALSAPLVLPPNEAPPPQGYSLPHVDELPDGLRDRMNEFRQHPAGKWVLSVYKTHRRPAG